VNELFDAVSARIKAPYFGYALLSFFALNWRALFLLGTTEGTPQQRIDIFDAHTSNLTLLIFPLLISAAIVILTPWIRLFFGLISKKPFEWIDNIQLESEHRINIRKTELEQSRADFFATKERALIERAKRDLEVKSVEDRELQEKLKGEIEALRKESDSLTQRLNNQSSAVDFTAEEKDLLKAAADSSGGAIIIVDHLSGRHIQAGSTSFGQAGAREFAKYDSALRSLLSKGLIEMTQATNPKSFELTTRGWHIADSL
jgi:hypothetical protein